MTAVGFVGLGAMGFPMAANALHAGFDVMVHDVRPEPLQALAAMGAKGARSYPDIGRHSDVVEVVVQTDEQIEDCMHGPDGVLAHVNRGAVVIVHSTVHPETIRRIDRAGREKGVEVLDAQMVGGYQVVERREQTFIVGGDAQVLERCRPVLNASGSTIFHMGGVGMGATTKLAQQLITVVSLLARSEGFRLAEKAGVDLDLFQQLLAVSSAQANASPPDRMRSPDRRDPRPFYYGLRPILGLAFDLDVQVPGAALAQQIIPWEMGKPGDIYPRERAESQA